MIDCDCRAELGSKHKKNCASMICPHCSMAISIRNPSGYCDHVYYPECCWICRNECFLHLFKFVDKLCRVLTNCLKRCKIKK